MLDINVWLALASKRHIHNQTAVRWFDSVGDSEAGFCRITQMGFLRLLTNPRAMGVDVITQDRAWDVYQFMTTDLRVQFVAEPAGLEDVWRRLTRKLQPAVNLWTDAYLQAFAQLKDLQIVSFDRGFERYSEPEALILR